MRNILPFLLLCGVCLPACADVAFINGWTNTVYVTGAAEFALPAGASFSFAPAPDATNEINFDIGGGGAMCQLQDGVLYAVNSEGAVDESPVLRSVGGDLSEMESYFVYGLESGAGLGVILFGWIAVKRGLRLGDVME
jgi:hypothetical protein